MEPSRNAGALAEWRQHWKVVLAAVAGMSISTLPSYSAALLYTPFEQEFGWARAQVAAPHIIASIAAIVFSPFVGALIDRHGPRRIGIAAAVLMCLFVPLISLVGPKLWTLSAFYLAMSLPTVLIQPMVWTSAITSQFSSGRGFALAVTLCGSGIGSILIPPLTFELISTFGWRTGFILLGAIWGAGTIPLVILFFRGARDAADAPPLASHHPSLRAILSGEVLTRRFLQLVLAGFCFAIVAVPAITQMVPILGGNGLSLRQAAYVASFAGFASITGRLTIGLLLDRLPGRLIAVGCLALPVIGALILIQNPGSVPAATVAVLVFGLALGAELDIMAYLTSRYCPVRNFGMLFGIIGGAIGIAGSTGPIALNAVYDATGSYHPALWGMIPLCLVAALLFLLLGPYPDAHDRMEHT